MEIFGTLLRPHISAMLNEFEMHSVFCQGLNC